MAKTPDTTPDPSATEQFDPIADIRGYDYVEAGAANAAHESIVWQPATDNPKQFNIAEWRDLPQQQKDTNLAGVQMIREALAEAKKQQGRSRG